MTRTVIKGGRVVTPGGEIDATIIIDGERIAGIVDPDVEVAGDATIDATGLIVLPGAIDAHTHFIQDDPAVAEPNAGRVRGLRQRRPRGRGRRRDDGGRDASGQSADHQWRHLPPSARTGRRRGHRRLRSLGRRLCRPTDERPSTSRSRKAPWASRPSCATPIRCFPASTTPNSWRHCGILRTHRISSGSMPRVTTSCRRALQAMQREGAPIPWRTTSRARRSSRSRLSTGPSSSPSRPEDGCTSCTSAPRPRPNW